METVQTVNQVKERLVSELLTESAKFFGCREIETYSEFMQDSMFALCIEAKTSAKENQIEEGFIRDVSEDIYTAGLINSYLTKINSLIQSIASLDDKQEV